MSWAWFIAGTPTVVLSRWNADALSVTAFSSELHRNLRRQNNSNDNAETVRQSMLKLRQSKDRTPYDWSGFMILGDPGVIINQVVRFMSATLCDSLLLALRV